MLYAVLLMAACSPATGPDTQDITLNKNLEIVINAPVSSRSITVEELDVTSLDIRITELATGSTVMLSNWYPWMGATTMPFSGNSGNHRIEVTHNSISNNTSVTETANFSLTPMKITRITITPGNVGVVVIGGEPVTNTTPDPVTNIRFTITWTNVPFSVILYNGNTWNFGDGNTVVTGSSTILHTSTNIWAPNSGLPVAVDLSNHTASVSINLDPSEAANIEFTMSSSLGWDYGYENPNHFYTIDPNTPEQHITVGFNF